MASVLKTLEDFKAVAAVSAEFSELVSIVDLAKMRGEENTRNIRDYLNSKGIKPFGKLGSIRMYKKSEVLNLIKESA